MRVTYDGQVNAAYIYLQPIGPGEVKRTHVCGSETDGPARDVNLDFDSQGRLIGVEVLYASHRLPKAFIDDAEKIG